MMTALPQASAQEFRLPREFRAAWVATVDNIDWPSKPGLTTPEMKREMVTIMETADRLGLNAIIFQIRPHADSLYKSPIEPWSYYLTGVSGQAPADGFDPLEFAIAEAHKRGIELHVWLNPYRAGHPAQKGPYSQDHIINRRPDLVGKYGNFVWMDPGQEEVQDQSFEVFMDVVQRYNIDGLHIDDYFYPYPVTENGVEVPFPDEASFQAARRQEPNLNRGDWRRRNVNRFVRRVYDGIKRRKPWVKFGISPFGIYRPGVPKGIRAGVDQYAQLYADAKLWLQNGWCDYFTPQLYWPITQTPQAFPTLLNWWHSVNTQKRHLWPGQFTSRLNPTGGNWKPQEIVDQIQLVRRKGGMTNGTVHFSMKAFLQDWNGINKPLMDGVYRTKAVVPASPWLDAVAPGAPQNPTASVANGGVIARTDDPDVRFVTVSVNRGGWRFVGSGLPGQVVRVPNLKAGEDIRVSLLDRVGNEGQAVTIKATD
ncbi:MAG: family 10 glycosylhydrolase [Fimbriimonadaceae bacterium]|nr:family 10 glycosylhydrolase [Fimbriimonadaceae bacterium]